MSEDHKVIQGDALEALPRNNFGRFIRGVHYSLKTEFKGGEHWRKEKLYWNRDWLYQEYIEDNKTANQIAKEQDCSEKNIFYFVEKFNFHKSINALTKIRRKSVIKPKREKEDWWPKYWNIQWLHNEYVVKKKSANDIAKEQDCSEGNILAFLKKFNIPRRSISEARKVKYWGLNGKQNGMYGKNGDANPNWKGGISPERQAFYSSNEWKEALRKVWARDYHTCQRCGHEKISQEKFNIHHMVSFEVRELRVDINNLILLCKNCHDFVHSKANINREFLEVGGDPDSQ